MEGAYSMILSIITASTAVVALFFSGFQIHQSNKQHLLDRRIKIWSITTGLCELCKIHIDTLKEEDNKKGEPLFSVDFQFIWFTNNAYLSDITDVINNTLDPILQNAFLKKIEDIKRLSVESGMVFRRRTSAYIIEFLDSYQVLLFSMYQYQILLTNLQKDSERFHWSLDEAMERLYEDRFRTKLYDAKKRLLNSYRILEQSEVKNCIVRQIRLTLR